MGRALGLCSARLSLRATRTFASTRRRACRASCGLRGGGEKKKWTSKKERRQGQWQGRGQGDRDVSSRARSRTAQLRLAASTAASNCSHTRSCLSSRARTFFQQLRDLGDQRVVRIRIGEQGADGEEDWTEGRRGEKNKPKKKKKQRHGADSPTSRIDAAGKQGKRGCALLSRVRVAL